MHENSHKMKLSNPAVVIVAVVLSLLSSTVVIYFPLVSEQQESEPGSALKLEKQMFR